jgi:hypothetical protein
MLRSFQTGERRGTIQSRLLSATHTALVANGGFRLIAVGIAFGLAWSALVTRVLQVSLNGLDLLDIRRGSSRD